MTRSLWDRQIYALGKDSTSRIHNSNLLLLFDQRKSNSCSLLIELTKNLILLGFKSLTIAATTSNSDDEGNVDNSQSIHSYVQWENIREEFQRLNPEKNSNHVEYCQVDDNLISNLNKFSCLIKCGIDQDEHFEWEFNLPSVLLVQVNGLMGRLLTCFSSLKDSQEPQFHSRCLLEGPILHCIYEETRNSFEEFDKWLDEYFTKMNEELFELFDEKSLSMNDSTTTTATTTNTCIEEMSQVKSQLKKYYQDKFNQYEKTKNKSCYPMISLFSAFAANQILCEILSLKKEENSFFYFEQLNLSPFLQNSLHTLEDLNILIVGAGAIGCELVKNLLVMNACTGKGYLHVTDMDSIELTNLNRQFFFSMDDIGLKKSNVMKKMVNKFNPKVNIKVYHERVEESTKLRSEEFWSTLDVVFGAVDNDQARKYLSNKCYSYGIPFINSGTHAFHSQNSFHLNGETKPFQSETQKTEQDEWNEIRTSCTLKSNPEKPEDLIMWSKMKFEDYFSDHKFLQTSSLLMSNRNSQDLNEKLYTLARDMFKDMFVKPFKENPNCDPKNLTSEEMINYYLDDQSVFTPRPVQLNLENNSTHCSFLNSSIRLLHRHLVSNNILGGGSVGSISFPFPELSSKALTQFELAVGGEKKCSTQRDELEKSLKTPFKPLSYDKDDEVMVQFIHDVSNIRAENFFLFGRSICSEIDLLVVKKIAGAIHPALVTTTSVSASIQCFHLMQYIQQKWTHVDPLPFIKYNVGLKDLDVRVEMITDKSKLTTIRMNVNDTINDLVLECNNHCPDSLETICYISIDGKNVVLYNPEVFPKTGEPQHLEKKLGNYFGHSKDGIQVDLTLMNEHSETHARLHLFC